MCQVPVVALVGAHQQNKATASSLVHTWVCLIDTPPPRVFALPTWGYTV